MHTSDTAVQLDEFKLDLGSLDLGELQKVDIGFATKQSVSGMLGGLVGKKWNLTSVEVRGDMQVCMQGKHLHTAAHAICMSMQKPMQGIARSVLSATGPHKLFCTTPLLDAEGAKALFNPSPICLVAYVKKALIQKSLINHTVL